MSKKEIQSNIIKIAASILHKRTWGDPLSREESNQLDEFMRQKAEQLRSLADNIK